MGSSGTWAALAPGLVAGDVTRRARTGKGSLQGDRKNGGVWGVKNRPTKMCTCTIFYSGCTGAGSGELSGVKSGGWV
jgi:hypothetical protein